MEVKKKVLLQKKHGHFEMQLHDSCPCVNNIFFLFLNKSHSQQKGINDTP